MKAEKITERFPFTFPKIAAANPDFPLWLLKKLLPKASHWSGTTPHHPFFSTAEEWSEAFLKTLGLWEDGE